MEKKWYIQYIQTKNRNFRLNVLLVRKKEIVMPDFDIRDREGRNPTVFGRIIYEPLGMRQTLYCETEEGFMKMVHALIENRVWFDVDFPEMDMPIDDKTNHTFLKGEI